MHRVILMLDYGMDNGKKCELFYMKRASVLYFCGRVSNDSSDTNRASVIAHSDTRHNAHMTIIDVI